MHTQDGKIVQRFSFFSFLPSPSVAFQVTYTVLVSFRFYLGMMIESKT
ncbi:hypothetical protein YN1HA_18640 [Sulfurisphaera ohwakuensis]